MTGRATVRMIVLMVLINTVVLTVFIGLIMGEYVSLYPTGLLVAPGLLVTDICLFFFLRRREPSVNATPEAYGGAVKIFDLLAVLCLGGAILSLVIAISTRELAYLGSVAIGLSFAFYLRYLANKVRKNPKPAGEAH